MVDEEKKDKKIIPRLDLEKTDKEGLRRGIKSDGRAYSVREHRNSFIMPIDWLKFIEAIRSPRAILTMEVLIQTGSRINEARNIEERDIDYERNNIRLRITKTKARKGEKIGKPRTIPISSAFTKKLKKHFSRLPGGSKINLLSTPACNLCIKKALKKINHPEWYMISAHSIRKSHGNWLKVLGTLNLMAVDASEICLRLGHSYDTFLAHYGSSSIFSSEDVQIAKQILGDLYSR